MSKKILLSKCGPDIHDLTPALIDAHLDLLNETDSNGKTLLHLLGEQHGYQTKFRIR